MASIGLCLITKDLDSILVERINSLAPYVDTIYVQVNGKPSKQKWDLVGNVKLSTYTWNDNFADARNALLKEVKTNYWSWVDGDDEIITPFNFLPVVARMESEGIDILMAPYIYQYDDQGNPTELQNRERIIRTSLKGQWYGAIHETFIPDTEAVTETTSLLTWVHRKTKAGHAESMLRNRGILEREHRQRRDPRIAYYLGLNYGMDGHYQEAIECFKELIETGGWDEERYRAYLQIFSCYFELKDYAQAASAALEATKELPEYPDAYFLLQQLYYQVDDHQKALEWYKVGRSKPLPKSDSAFNPLVRVEQPRKLAAYSFLAVGNAKQAMATLLELQKLNPNYQIEPGLKQVTMEAVNEENAITNAKNLIEYTKAFGGDPKAVLDSLPPVIRSDVRLTKQRRELMPVRRWATGTIAIYCGPSYETWGPDTLDKGMGGSEEAIVYLARELTRNKHGVTVFNERQESYSDPVKVKEFTLSVYYRPWTDISPNDEFDTFVAWRSPAGLENVKANRKILDLHDIIPTEDVYNAIPYTDYFFFKSQFHRELYPEVPEEKVAIIPNGIVPEHFS